MPESVLQTADKLKAAGFRAYLTGGSLRDLILKRKPKDWDVVTDAPRDELIKIFPDNLEVGLAFGILKLKNHPDIDVATLRKDGPYKDGRRPQYVKAGTALSDALRRDFTINSIYLDLVQGQVMDFTHGLADLKSELIRSVGRAEKRFSEDGLRILRALRFSAQLDFDIESKTFLALKQCKKMLRHISRERIRHEVMLALGGPGAALFLKRVQKLGLAPYIFTSLPEKKFAEAVKNLPITKHLALRPEIWLGFLMSITKDSDLKSDLCLANAEFYTTQNFAKIFRCESPLEFGDEILWQNFSTHEASLREVRQLTKLPKAKVWQKLMAAKEPLSKFHASWSAFQRELITTAQGQNIVGQELGKFLKEEKKARLMKILYRDKAA